MCIGEIVDFTFNIEDAQKIYEEKGTKGEAKKKSEKKFSGAFYSIILRFMHNITRVKDEICDPLLVTRLTVHEYR